MTYRTSSNRLHVRFLDKALEFFDRPYGGVELESAIAIIEVCWGLAIFSSSDSLWHTLALQEFAWWDWFTRPFIALLWLAAGFSSLMGIALFLCNFPLCAHLRYWGGIGSGLLWGFMLMQFVQIQGTTQLLPHGIVYMVFMLCQIRILYSARRRWSR